jgi:hypothetical protein
MEGKSYHPLLCLVPLVIAGGIYYKNFQDQVDKLNERGIKPVAVEGYRIQDWARVRITSVSWEGDPKVLPAGAAACKVEVPGAGKAIFPDPGVPLRNCGSYLQAFQKGYE